LLVKKYSNGYRGTVVFLFTFFDYACKMISIDDDDMMTDGVGDESPSPSQAIFDINKKIKQLEEWEGGDGDGEEEEEKRGKKFQTVSHLSVCGDALGGLTTSADAGIGPSIYLSLPTLSIHRRVLALFKVMMMMKCEWPLLAMASHKALYRKSCICGGN
jgi:hypothetical protein